MAGDGAHGAEGKLENGRAAASEGPAAEPAAIGPGIEADHLIKLTVGGMIPGQRFWQADAVPLVKVHESEQRWCGRRWLQGQILILA
jgi:hypothetical protein